MNSEIELIEVAVEDKIFQESAKGVLEWGWELQNEIQTEAQWLIQLVLNGSTTVKDLRAGVAWANSLDRESVAMYGAELVGGDQLLERTARRIMHGAGRAALNIAKSRRKLTAYRACNQ